MDCKTIEGQQPVRVESSIHMYEAEISAQAILSYKWLADQNFLVQPVVMIYIFRTKILKFLYQGYQKKGVKHKWRASTML